MSQLYLDFKVLLYLHFDEQTLVITDRVLVFLQYFPYNDNINGFINLYFQMIGDNTSLRVSSS